MDDQKQNIAEQNRRKLQEHLENIKKHGGVPPKFEQKKARPTPAQPVQSVQQQAAQREQKQFRKDWESWRRVYGGRVIDLSAKPVEDNTGDYRILGLAPNATQDEIRKAFYAMAKDKHPDKGGDVDKFRELMEAYNRLSAQP